MHKCNLAVSYCVVLEYLVLVYYFVWRVIKGGAFVCMTYLFFACIILYNGSSKEESSYLSPVACSFLYYPVWYLIRRGFISIPYLFTSYLQQFIYLFISCMMVHQRRRTCKYIHVLPICSHLYFPIWWFIKNATITSY